MNNLHRGLAPISDAAWAQIEEEASRTLKRHLAARRVGMCRGRTARIFRRVGTGHQRQIEAPGGRHRGGTTRGQSAGRIARAV